MRNDALRAIVCLTICWAMQFVFAPSSFAADALDPEDHAALKKLSEIVEEDRDWARIGVCGTSTIPSGDLVIQVYGSEDASVIYPGFTKRLVTCVRSLVNYVIDNQLGSALETFSGVVTTLVTLYLIIFGIKVALGDVKSLKGDLIVVVLTISIVIYAVRHSGAAEYLGIFLDVQAALVGFVTESVGQVEVTLGNSCADYIDTWQRLDCVMAYYMGVDPKEFAGAPGGMAVAPYYAFDGDNETSRKGITLAPFLAIVGLSFTSISPYLLLMGILVPVLMVAAFAQAVVVYIGSMFVVVFLGVVSPFIIPLVMFTPTKQIFKFWFQLLISYTLQPAILMAYLAFMIHVIAYFFSEKSDQYVGMPLERIYQQVYGITSADKDAQQSRRLRTEVAESESKIISGATPIEAPTTESVSLNTEKAGMWAPNFILDMIGSPQGADFYDLNNNDVFEVTEQQEMNKRQKEGAENFLFNMMVMLLILAMTFGFMSNVMAFGAALAGISAQPINQAVDIYNMTLSRVSSGGKK